MNNYMPQYQMPQQNNIYGQQIQRPAYQPSTNAWNNVNRVRPVSSIEEVRASAIDFDGSVFYFPDLANKKIYTKFINLDGTASINMYELKEMPTNPPVENNQYITRQEFENVISQLKTALQQPAAAPMQSPQEPRKELPLF